MLFRLSVGDRFPMVCWFRKTKNRMHGWWLIWEKVAECANLDKGERKILELRLTGFTREIVLQRFAENEEERRKLQAAWRRLDRHMDRVRAVLSGQKKLAKNVPKR